MPMPQQTCLFASPDETPSGLVRTMEHLAEDILPTKAASGAYPVRFDHCFKRIAYDVAVGAKWDTDVTPPFCANATPAQLRRAIDVLRAMARDPDRAHEYNRYSLRCRNADA
ncbi:hypothetical protein [Salinibacter ruber]|uniref:hypothetical protein n=2 Tax=Salinibacter ruber TaxID=146919 RepID=UPI0021679F95|nr:hypothetical protein [Salinibacter ruber]